jgi:hypothetical protein
MYIIKKIKKSKLIRVTCNSEYQDNFLKRKEKK